MPDLSTHPTAQALALFGHGQLSEAQAATVAAHLETCATCSIVVADLAPDSFLGKVQAAKPGGTWIDTCPVSPDGRTYSGENQVKVQISGVYSEDE